MVINDLLRKYEENLQDEILILCKLLDVDKSYIYTYGDRKLSREIVDEFIRLMEKRISGYPIQYILGEKEFMGLNFYLEEGVLVPRQDTEILVEDVIAYVEENYENENINILDLGIGSGAIALSLAKYCKNARIIGVDISDQAIKIGNINKERFALSNVEFFKGDLFKALEREDIEKKFHIIVSNPPYIPRKDIEDLDIQVKDFEPKLALDGGLDGLDFYRRITRESKEYLRENGLLVYEIGYDQADKVSEILIKEGFNKVSIKKDLQKHNRVVCGFLN